jgi:hypothetical protein
VGQFKPFAALYTGALNERLEYVLKDGDISEESPKWRIFTIRRDGVNYRVAFQAVREVTGKDAAELGEVVGVVEELAGLVGNNEPVRPEKLERRRG